jgi:hypothetical protein
MKAKSNRLFFVLMLCLVGVFMAACSPVASVSADATIPPDVLDIILKIALGFASLVGVSKLVAVLVQLGKLAKLVKDGTSDMWAAVLNLVAFAVLVFYGVFQPSIVLSVLDGYAAQFAEILLFILGFIIQITGSQPAYLALKAARVPLLSKSYTSA